MYRRSENGYRIKRKGVPFQSKPHRLNSEDQKDLDRIITEWKTAGIVSETNSEFASPIVLARKKDGSPRPIPDYRKLNKITKEYNFLIPNFEDLLETLTDAKFFVILDLASGYLQIPLEENAKEKTAFITETQTGQFERAIFGLKNAPMYFAKLIDKVLGITQKKGIAFTFFYDTCIYAKTWDELMVNLEYILSMFKRG